MYRYDLVLFAHKTLRKAAESSASACAEGAEGKENAEDESDTENSSLSRQRRRSIGKTDLVLNGLEVPQPVAARLSGLHGKGLAQITKLTVGAVQVESS